MWNCVLPSLTVPAPHAGERWRRNFSGWGGQDSGEVPGGGERVAGEAPLHERVWDLSLCSITARGTRCLITFPSMRCVFWDQGSSQAQCVHRWLISFLSWGWCHHADSWKTQPKELSPSLKAMMEPRDGGEGGTWSVQGVMCISGGQQTAEEPCASQPSARHGKGEAGPITVLIVLIPVLFGKRRVNAFAPGEA